MLVAGHYPLNWTEASPSNPTKLHFPHCPLAVKCSFYSFLGAREWQPWDKAECVCLSSGGQGILHFGQPSFNYSEVSGTQQ